MKFEFIAPIRIESEANRSAGRHYQVRRKRFEDQKKAVHYMLIGRPFTLRWLADHPPLVVTLTRIAPRKIDSDNLASGFKGVRDQIAADLGIDDGDDRIEWQYGQRRGRPGEYEAHIAIETKEKGL